MRILLDTRDLINVVDRNAPISLADFEAYLQAGNHQLVLSNTSVREFAGPLARGGEFLRLRPLLQSLERLPHTYIKEITIVAEELGAAIASFTTGVEPAALSPFADRWDRTMAPLPDGEQSITDMLVGLRLDEVVHAIYRVNPLLFASPEYALPKLRALRDASRDLFHNGQTTHREHFVRYIKVRAAHHRVPLPDGREDEFAGWVYENPNRCPGFRLSYEVLSAVTANYGDDPKAGDFGDLGQVFAVPYVDVATLDNRFRDYVRIASQKIGRMVGKCNYSEHICTDVGDVMRRFP